MLKDKLSRKKVLLLVVICISLVASFSFYFFTDKDASVSDKCIYGSSADMATTRSNETMEESCERY